MSEKRRNFDQDFTDGAVRIVLESGRPVAEIARELDVHQGTLANWVHKARASQREAGRWASPNVWVPKLDVGLPAHSRRTRSARHHDRRVDSVDDPQARRD